MALLENAWYAALTMDYACLQYGKAGWVAMGRCDWSRLDYILPFFFSFCVLRNRVLELRVHKFFFSPSLT